MARTYSVSVAAVAVGAPRKWVENLLAQHVLPGISRDRRGVERQISDDGLLAIAVTRLLHTELTMTVGKAVQLARDLIGNGGAATVQLGPGLTLRLAGPEIDSALRLKVVEAMEVVAHVPRGRPRGR